MLYVHFTHSCRLFLEPKKETKKSVQAGVAKEIPIEVTTHYTLPIVHKTVHD